MKFYNLGDKTFETDFSANRTFDLCGSHTRSSTKTLEQSDTVKPRIKETELLLST